MFRHEGICYRSITDMFTFYGNARFWGTWCVHVYPARFHPDNSVLCGVHLMNSWNSSKTSAPLLCLLGRRVPGGWCACARSCGDQGHLSRERLVAQAIVTSQYERVQTMLDQYSCVCCAVSNTRTTSTDDSVVARPHSR
jgi:hypothetical protein